MSEDRKIRIGWSATALCLLWSSLAMAHGGDGHDLSTLRLEAPEAEAEHHHVSRLRFNLSMGMWNRVASGQSEIEREELPERAEKQGLVNGSWEVSEGFLLGANWGASDFSGIGDPLVYVLVDRPLFYSVRWLLTSGVAAPFSIESRSDDRLFTAQTSSGVIISVARWSFLFLANLAVPVGRGSHRDEEQQARLDEHEERFRTGTIFSAAYQLRQRWKLETQANWNALALKQGVSKYISEWLLAKLSYSEPAWEVGFGIGLNDESPTVRLPQLPISRVNFTARY